MDITKLPSGTLVNNNRIEEVIGRGGYGIVYLATDLEHNRKVALKFLNKETVREQFKLKHVEGKLSPEQFEEEFSKHFESIINRFKEEYQKQLIGIHHPNIASVYQFGFFDENFFFTSEYIDGYDIFVHTRPISEISMVTLFIQMFEGIQFIHDNGLLHGDIKPENVLISEVNGKPAVKIIDFGIATAITANKKHLLGTPMFIAPEAILGWEERIGINSDLFSAAALMYYCLSNSYPFKNRYGWDENPKKLAHIVKEESMPKALKKRSNSIPEYLNTIVMRLLEKNPEDRFYGSARAVINALKTRCPDDFRETKGIKSSYLISDKHIGYNNILEELNNNFNLLVKDIQPDVSIYCVTGENGLGKTYFLQEIKKKLEKKIKDISLHEIGLPIDDEWAKTWTNNLSQDLEKSEKPVVILADNVHLLNDKELSCGLGLVKKALLGLFCFLKERSLHPELHKILKPVLFCFSALPNQMFFKKDECRSFKIIDLKPFTKNEIEGYLRSTIALKNKKISSDWVDMLLRQTEGVPGELREQLIQLDSENLLFDIDGNVHLFSAQIPSITGEKLKSPLSTESRLLKQYNSLMPIEKRLVNFLSTWNFGKISPTICLEDLKYFFPVHEIHLSLTNLCKKQILECHRNKYIFLNPYFSDLVYRSTDCKEQQKHHGHIAQYLKKMSATKEAIQIHSGLGGVGAVSISNLIKLSRTLIFKKGRVFLAQELLKKAFDLCKNTENSLIILEIYIHYLLVHAYCYAGQYIEAQEVYHQISEIMNAKSANFPVILKLRLYLAVLPAFVSLLKYEEAEKIIIDAKKLADIDKYPVQHILFLNWEGRINYDRRADGSEYLIRAKDIFEKSSEIEKILPHKKTNLITNNELGQVLLMLGESKAAVKEMKKKLVRCKANKNPFLIMLATLSLAEAWRNCGKYSKAVKYSRRALELARTINVGRWLVNIHLVLAACYFDWKKFDSSIEQNYQCIAASACLSNPEEHNALLRHIWSNIGNCYNEKERWNESPKYFEAALEYGARDFMKVRAKLGIAEAHLHVKKLDESLAELDEADKTLTELPDIRKGWKFVSKFLRYNCLIAQEKKDMAKGLLPELKILAENNSEFLKEFRKICQ